MNVRADFLADHRAMTRGIHRLRQDVADGDHHAAARHAAELDVVAGPHIRFEEEYFYPVLESVLGAATVDRFLHEHDAGRSALLRLLDRDPEQPFDDEERRCLLQDLDAAMDHARSCGTLASHLEEMDDSRLGYLADGLKALRTRHDTWTSRAE
jgi:hypothetical protein